MSLVVKALSKTYGGLTAVNGVSFNAKPGQITAVIGPNGAGKTTLLNLISGVIRSDAGSVHLHDRNLTGLGPHHLARFGLARTYQNPQLFEDMTVLENVMIGAHLKGGVGFLGAVLNRARVNREDAALRSVALDALERVGLSPGDADRNATELPYGLQRKVDIARAIAMKPTALLLDEPAAGLNAKETDQISGLTMDLAKQGYIIILVEHDMDMVMNISEHIVVMNFGKKIAEGTPGEVQSHPEVIEAYLGMSEEA
jgi:branched-chain amino acid transport system ATP-binding protein